MLIVSKFHDYYDSAMSFGIDKDTVYNRTTSEIKLEYKTLERDVKNSREYRSAGLLINGIFHDYYQFVIGFCGKLYPGIRLSYWNNRNNYSETIKHFFYDKESLIKFMDSGNFKFEKRSYSFGSELKCKQGIEGFFNSNSWKSLDKYFWDNHVPIFLLKPTNEHGYNQAIELNPLLKPLKFMRIKDPHTTFQEIHQYLAGVLGNIEKDTTSISDNDRIKQHGYDKWSFRKLPTKRK